MLHSANRSGSAPIHRYVVLDGTLPPSLRKLVVDRISRVRTREQSEATVLPLALLESAAVLVMGAHDTSGRLTFQRVAEIRALAANLDIVVCDMGQTPGVAELREFARAGADDVLNFNRAEEAQVFWDHLSRRLAAPVPAGPLREMVRHESEATDYRIVTWCLRNGVREDAIPELERLFQIDVTTVNRRMRRAGWPTPSQLLRLSRVYHASELSMQGGMRASDVAMAVGYPSASAMNTARARLRAVGLLTDDVSSLSRWREHQFRRRRMPEL